MNRRLPRLRRLLLMIGAGLLLVGLASPAWEVSNQDGEICGSAYRSVKRELSRGGERTSAQIDADLDACQVAGERALRRGAWAGGAGAVLLLVVGLAPSRRRDVAMANPGGGGR